MNPRLVLGAALLSGAVAPQQAPLPKPKSMSAADYIARDGLDQGVRHYVAHKFVWRRYFEGSSPTDCTTPVKPDRHFANIPVVDCTYQLSGLTGWARLADPPADLIADWILHAARLCDQPERCAAKLATDAWNSNQYSFPIAANIIEPGDSGGGSSTDATNFIFIDGVTISRPEVLPATTSISVDLQRACLLALLATANGDHADPVPGDPTGSCTKLAVAQVSRPAAIRQDIYVAYGGPPDHKRRREAEVGASCPADARKTGWLTVSRRTFVQGWKTRAHPLFDTAARAINAGEDWLGKLTPC